MESTGSFSSLEFFAFPGYMSNVASTMTCLQNLKDLTGTWPPMRIGGTTQCVLACFQFLRGKMTGC